MNVLIACEESQRVCTEFRKLGHRAFSCDILPYGKKKRQVLWFYKTRCLPHLERAKAASKTFSGIAKAMAEQWGGINNA